MPFENSAGLTLPERCKEKRAQWGETPLRLLLHLLVHLLQRACALHKTRLKALYHERTLAIMTGEPRICTLACTPGATKALADAHARTTRRDLNIFYSDLAEQFRRRRSGS